MKNGIEKYLFATALLVMFFLSGCAMHIKMNQSLNEVNIGDKHINARVGLFLDNTFSDYHWHGNNVAEMSKMDYELGAASKNLFLEAFMRLCTSVTLVNAEPPYVEPDKKDITIVVKPAIIGFSEDHSAILRVANYTASITYHVKVTGAQGETLIDRDYTGTGVAKGEATYSPASNYAAAAEKAMTAALSAIIGDIVQRNVGG